MRDVLSVALAKSMGRVLTLEVARQIVDDAMAQKVDCSFSPAFWKAQEYRGYSMQCQRLRDEPDLMRHRQAYRAEVFPGEPWQPDMGRLLALQRSGASVIFVAYKDGNLVASLWLYPSTSVDTGRYTVSDDLFYIEPEHRGGFLAVRLWQYAEKAMFKMGAREATFHSRMDNGAERLAQFMGYRPTATRVHKFHPGDNYADLPSRHEGPR